MSGKVVDLSVALSAGIRSGPPGFPPKIDYLAHDAGAHCGMDDSVMTGCGMGRAALEDWARPSTERRGYSAALAGAD